MEVVEESFVGSELRDKTLNYFAEGFENGVVKDGGAVMVEHRVFDPGIKEVVGDVLDDFGDDFTNNVLADGVGLVAKDGVLDVRIDFAQADNGVGEAAGGKFVSITNVNDPDDAANAREDEVGVEADIKVVDLGGKIPQAEVHERAGSSGQPLRVSFQKQMYFIVVLAIAVVVSRWIVS